MKQILTIIIAVGGFLAKLFKRSNENKRINEDRDVAKDIRSGDGRKVAEEWKRRKKYRK